MTAHRALRRLGLSVAVFALLLLPARARAATAANADLPRYDLPVGRVLTYVSEDHAHRADGKPGMESHGTARITVVAANADGSRRVIVRTTTKYPKGPASVSMSEYDVFPDGRSKHVGAFSPENEASNLFPLLPPDAAATAVGGTWTRTVDWSRTVTTYTAAAAPEGDAFVYSAAVHGPLEPIYRTTHKLTIHFDRHKGLMAQRDEDTTQDWGVQQTGTSKTTLDKVETIDPAQAAALGSAYQKFFDADDQYDKILGQLHRTPDDAPKLLDQARAVLTTAASGVTEPQVAREFQLRIKDHDDSLQDTLDDAKRIAGVLNHPLPDFEAQSLDGKTWHTADLKGKIVVLDFWYRGCGWCMYSMPQIKQLATDYKDKPVLILGMNVDQKPEDAEFVVKHFGLDYPQLKVRDLRKRFGIQGFPSLLILDATGVVRTFDVGYAPDVHQKIAKRIDDLLSKQGVAVRSK